MERAKETYQFHRGKRLENPKWTSRDTAKELKRSIGSISEDLTIASWIKTHEVKLIGFRYAYEALEWIREREAEREVEDV